LESKINILSGLGSILKMASKCATVNPPPGPVLEAIVPSREAGCPAERP